MSIVKTPEMHDPTTLNQGMVTITGVVPTHTSQGLKDTTNGNLTMMGGQGEIGIVEGHTEKREDGILDVMVVVVNTTSTIENGRERETEIVMTDGEETGTGTEIEIETETETETGTEIVQVLRLGVQYLHVPVPPVHALLEHPRPLGHDRLPQSIKQSPTLHHPDFWQRRLIL